MQPVGGDTEGEVVILGIDGKSQISGIRVAIEVDEVDIVAAEALPAVGDEVKRVAVGMQEREFLVAFSIDA